MQDAKIAASLMMEKDSEKVKEGVETLISCNQQRKKIQSETFEQCCNIVEEKYQTAPFLVIDLEDAHEGITGIVAGKLKEIYHRPAVIVTPTAGDCLKGTGRGIEGIDLYNLLKDNEELFERFGGHAAACGFTMKKQHLDTLRSRLNESMGRILADNPELADAHIQADLKLEAGDVNLQLVAELKMLEPFGCENPQPLVSIRLRPGSIRKMGNQNQYTKFIGVLDDGREIQCVIFKEAKSYDELLKKGQPLTVTGNLESQTWNGKQYLQITVQAIEE